MGRTVALAKNNEDECPIKDNGGAIRHRPDYPSNQSL